MSENNQEITKIELLKRLISELDGLQGVEINERALQFNRWLALNGPSISQQFDSQTAKEISSYKISSENANQIHIVDETRNTHAIMAIRDSRSCLKSLLDGVAKEDSTSVQPLIVISLHGIRTRGDWQKELTSVLGSAGFIHEPLDYGFYRAIRLVIPFMRAKQVKWFLEKYTGICEKHRNQRPSIVAHSFGTYLVAKALSFYPEVKFDQIIFVGSIVEQGYDWRSRFAGNQASRVLNQCAQKDSVVKIAEWIVNDAGPSGAKGFKDTVNGRVIERNHTQLGHSGYFYDLNYRHNWIPFLRGNQLPETSFKESSLSNWRFRVVKSSLILFFVVVMSLMAWVWHASLSRKETPREMVYSAGSPEMTAATWVQPTFSRIRNAPDDRNYEWFRFKVTADGRLEVSLYAQETDLMLRLHIAPNNDAVSGNKTKVAAGKSERVTVDVFAGETYIVGIQAYAGGPTGARLDVSYSRKDK